MIIPQQIIDLMTDQYQGWRIEDSVADLGMVAHVKPIVNDDSYTEYAKNAPVFNILKDRSLGNRLRYVLTVQRLTGSQGVLDDIPFLFGGFGVHGSIYGTVPTVGQMVVILYFGSRDTKSAICFGGVPAGILDRVADGTLPILKTGEFIAQSEIPEDAFDKDKKDLFHPGGQVYLDYKGRVIIKSVQNDSTIDGSVTITLGNAILDAEQDETASFVSKDETTDQELVYRLETASGVTINIDKEGNLTTTILKDSFTKAVNETTELSGNRTETIEGNEEKTVNGYYQLTNSDIRLGGEDVDERLVLGEQWKAIMEKLFTAIKNMTLNHPQGPTLPTPINWAEFEAIKSEFNNFEKALSEISKTKKR